MSSEEYKMPYMYDICNTSWRSEINQQKLLDVPENNVLESNLLFLKKRQFSAKYFVNLQKFSTFSDSLSYRFHCS